MNCVSSALIVMHAIDYEREAFAIIGTRCIMNNAFFISFVEQRFSNEPNLVIFTLDVLNIKNNNN